MMKKKPIPSPNKLDRRRGRPAGKNRTPLSLEERRSRNAQYERERRSETADAMAQLAEAACCDPQISNAELLVTVISQLRRRAKQELPEDIEDLKRINEKLESQIAELQSRLGHDGDVDMNEIPEDLRDYEFKKQIDCPSESHSRKKETSKNCRPTKIPKTSRSSHLRHKITYETDCDIETKSLNSTSSAPSEARYQLRTRRPKSEKSETTSTLYGTESESSQCAMGSPRFHFENSNQSDEHTVNEPNDPALTTITEQYEYTTNYTDLMETTKLGTLTDSEKEILNQWLNYSESFILDTEANRTNS